MPELPEVQTTVDGINHYAKGQTITDVWTDYGSLQYEGKNHIKNKLFFTKFKKEVVGAKIKNAERRAKNVLINLNNGKSVLIHMKMTGHILYGIYEKTSATKDPWKPIDTNAALKDSFNKFIHLVFTLSPTSRKAMQGKQSLHYLVLSDMRKFAKVTLIPTKELFESDDLKNLGPEPLIPSFTAKVLQERLLKRPNEKIKLALMDQSLVSGIGNIYSDEILFASNIHPLSQVKALKAKDFQLIWKNIKIILRKGIDFGGDSMSDYRNLEGRAGTFQYEHKAYRKTGKPCAKNRCKGVVHRLKMGGRSAHFCPVHQKLLK